MRRRLFGLAHTGEGYYGFGDWGYGYIGQVGEDERREVWEYLDHIDRINREIGNLAYELSRYYNGIARVLMEQGFAEEAEKVRRISEKLWDLHYHFVSPKGKYVKYADRVRDLVVEKFL